MTTPVPTQPERTKRKLSQLKDYPLQAQTYAPTSGDEDERLKAVLRTGHYDPLHIMPPHNKAGLPADTKLDGHRRARLLQDLGIDTAEVIVRHDLVNAERAVVDMAFYDFALGRRNSQPLDLARMVMDRYEIEKKRPRQRFGWRDYEETRDHIGKVLGMSGRNFGRYYNVLLGPREVQDAFRDKRLKLDMAARVAGLTPKQQEEIAARIRAGENPKDVVAAYFTASNGRHKRATPGFTALVKALNKALSDIGDRPDHVYRVAIKEQLPLLEQSKALLGKLISLGRKNPQTDKSMFDKGQVLMSRLKGNPNPPEPEV